MKLIKRHLNEANYKALAKGITGDDKKAVDKTKAGIMGFTQKVDELAAKALLDIDFSAKAGSPEMIADQAIEGIKDYLTNVGAEELIPEYTGAKQKERLAKFILQVQNMEDIMNPINKSIETLSGLESFEILDRAYEANAEAELATVNALLANPAKYYLKNNGKSSYDGLGWNELSLEKKKDYTEYIIRNGMKTGNYTNALFSGLPGVAKTAGVETWCEKKNVKCVVLDAKTMSKEDLSGVPYRKEVAYQDKDTVYDEEGNIVDDEVVDKTRDTLGHLQSAVWNNFRLDYSQFGLDGTGPITLNTGILFLDEVNAAPEEIKASLNTLINNHKITNSDSSMPFSENGAEWLPGLLFTVGAINPSDDQLFPGRAGTGIDFGDRFLQKDLVTANTSVTRKYLLTLYAEALKALRYLVILNADDPTLQDTYIKAWKAYASRYNLANAILTSTDPKVPWDTLSSIKRNMGFEGPDSAFGEFKITAENSGSPEVSLGVSFSPRTLAILLDTYGYSKAALIKFLKDDWNRSGGSGTHALYWWGPTLRKIVENATYEDNMLLKANEVFKKPAIAPGRESEVEKATDSILSDIAGKLDSIDDIVAGAFADLKV